jgi:hypothetical protein
MWLAAVHAGSTKPSCADCTCWQAESRRPARWFGAPLATVPRKGAAKAGASAHDAVKALCRAVSVHFQFHHYVYFTIAK